MSAFIKSLGVQQMVRVELSESLNDNMQVLQFPEHTILHVSSPTSSSSCVTTYLALGGGGRDGGVVKSLSRLPWEFLRFINSPQGFCSGTPLLLPLSQVKDV
jgi:hypothetical protein